MVKLAARDYHLIYSNGGISFLKLHHHGDQDCDESIYSYWLALYAQHLDRVRCAMSPGLT